jgi:tryptophan synthase alpha chain
MNGIGRIATAFARAKSERRGALIPYLCAGDPDAATTAAVLAAIASHADIIEIGIPYGDPLADGPTIAAAAQRALDAGMTIDGALALAKRSAESGARSKGGGVEAPPIIMFTYLNPIVQYGLERFAEAMLAAGVAGAIVPDAPLEEVGPIRAAFAPRGLALPQLVAPTTPFERAVAIAEASDGFVYLVSRLGVTSAKREPDFDWIAERIGQLRARTGKPIAVGFGIGTREHVRRVAAVADGAIVGSALIDAFAGLRGDEAAQRATQFLQSLRASPR